MNKNTSYNVKNKAYSIFEKVNHCGKFYSLGFDVDRRGNEFFVRGNESNHLLALTDGPDKIVVYSDKVHCEEDRLSVNNLIKIIDTYPEMVLKKDFFRKDSN